jgi:quercetin dioxygenase-like cupin family protein
LDLKLLTKLFRNISSTGKFEFILNGTKKIYQDGDVVVIPSNIPHSGKAITNCKLMDVFSPVREEYR